MAKVSIRGMNSDEAYKLLVQNGYPKLPNKGPGSAYATVGEAIAAGVVTKVASKPRSSSGGGRSSGGKPW